MTSKPRKSKGDESRDALRRSDTMAELGQKFSSVADVSPGDDDAKTAVEKESFLSDLPGEEASDSTIPEDDLAKVVRYMSSREMTPLQERVNAITIAPNPIYCAYFILSGLWISQDLVAQYRDEAVLSVDESLCFHSSWFPSLFTMPPATVIAVFFAITVHAPFSFIYHWTYAHELPHMQRTCHWSRRMDHSMIHMASAIISFATSGSFHYTLANVLFNADCIYRQFKPKVYPKRNQIRVLISMIAYTLPVVNRGDYALFALLWLVLGVGGWLFAAYPFRGWSHSAFHFVMLFLPPLLMQAASKLPSSVETMQVAAQCAVLAERASL